MTSNLFRRYAAIICKRSNLVGHQRMGLRIKITCHQNMNILVPRAEKLKNLLIPMINMECNPLGCTLLPAAHHFYVQENIPLVCTQCVGTTFFPFLTVPKIHGSVACNWHTTTQYILISQISELLKKNSASKFASTYFKNIFDISNQWVTQSRKIMKYTFPFKNLVCFLKVCKQSCIHRYVKSNKRQKASLCLVLIFN